MTDTKQTVHCISAKCFTLIAPNAEAMARDAQD
jgi:hypothetical protein